MLTNKRHGEILRLLEQKGSISLQELKDTLDASESTIRRDLTLLHEQGRLVKVFGGAVACENLNQSDELILNRQIQNVDAKQTVAHYAAGLIRPKDMVFLDAGSTTECLIPYLPAEAVYVTNAPGHAQRMSRKGLRVILLGGMMKQTTEAVVGTIASTQLENYNFNIAFLGTNGVSTHAQLSTPDPEEAMVKRMVIRRAMNAYVVCDHTKFNRISPVTFAQIEDVIILTESIPAGPYRDIPNIVDINQETAD